jgi:hypothetical protein
MAKIQNPAAPTEWIEFGVDVYSVDLNTGIVTPLFYDTYRLFVDMVSKTLASIYSVDYSATGNSIAFQGTRNYFHLLFFFISHRWRWTRCIQLICLIQLSLHRKRPLCYNFTRDIASLVSGWISYLRSG